MKIVSWNVNSVRARINNIIDYIKQAKPDILLVQEIKTQDENFPYEDFKKIGYESHVYGQKSYNGVAIISKIEVKNINKDFINDDLKQSRIITGEIIIKGKKINLINIYVPNGNPVETEKYDYKKNWLKKFISNIRKELTKNSNLIIAGDFNIIPEEIDVYDFKRYEKDALGKLEIRKKFRELINLGFKDVYRLINKKKKRIYFLGLLCWILAKKLWNEN